MNTTEKIHEEFISSGLVLKYINTVANAHDDPLITHTLLLDIADMLLGRDTAHKYGKIQLYSDGERVPYYLLPKEEALLLAEEIVYDDPPQLSEVCDLIGGTIPSLDTEV